MIVAGIAARCYGITHSLDGDEISSLLLANQSLGDTFANWNHNSHPPFHIILLNGWMSVFGTSEIAVRSLSISFSFGFLAVSAIILRRLTNRVASLAGLAILALSPYFVYLGQQARPYSLLAFLSVLSILVAARLHRDPENRKILAAWITLCVAMVYTQYFALLVVATEALVLYAFGRRRFHRFLTAPIIAGIAVVPWLYYVVFVKAEQEPTGVLGSIGWVEPPTLYSLAKFVIDTFGAIPGMQWLLAGLLLAATVAAVVPRLEVHRLSFLTWLLIALTLVLPICIFGVSVLGPVPVFGERHLIASAATGIMVLAFLFGRWPLLPRAALGIAFVAWCAVALSLRPPYLPKPPWQDIARAVDEQAERYVVVSENWMDHPLIHYARTTTVVLVSAADQLDAAQFRMYACRPFRCQLLELADSSRVQHVGHWTWGSENAEFEVVDLYRIN